MSCPILYNATEKNFDHNGIGILSACVSCEVTEEANGIFELAMQYPMDGIHYEYIADRAIIKAKADQFRQPQLFRVYAISKPMNGIVTVLAEHISYDLSGIPVNPFSANSVAVAMSEFVPNAIVECPFDFSTDKTTEGLFSMVAPASIRSCLGGSSGSILDVYGGEYEFDNYSVKLHNSRGVNRGVSIRYGKNLTDIQQEINCSSVATGVYPYWLGNIDETSVLVELPEKIIYAPGTYDFVKIRMLDLSSQFQEKPSVDELRSYAERFVTSNKIGIPKVSMTVSFFQLEQTEEYKNMRLLERVALFDSVNVEFPALGVSATAKAVKIVYDVVSERVKSVTLGTVQQRISDTIANQQTEIEKAKDKPTISMVQKISSALSKEIMGATGGAVRLIDTNGDGKPDELYIADNEDPSQAVKVWRFNYDGWAASKNGYFGQFEFGATLENGLLANFVTAANLVAGNISSQDGKTFFLDLDNGILKGNFSELTIRGGSVLPAPKITGQNSPVITVENALADSIEGLTLYGKTTQDGTPSPENPVELVCVGDSGAINTTVGGRNLFDASSCILNKRINIETGRPEDVFNGQCASDFIPVCPNEVFVINFSYFSGGNFGVAFYDKNKALVTGQKQSNTTASSAAKPFAFTIPSNCAFIRISTISELPLEQVMLNAGSEVLPYEPYKGTQTLTASTPNGLPGIPVSSGGNHTDASGQQWICDEIDFIRGVYVQRTSRLVFDGSGDESWALGSISDGVNNRFQIQIYRELAYEKVPTDTKSVCASEALCNGFLYSKVNGIPPTNRFRIAISDNGAYSMWYMVFNPSTEIIPLESLSAWKEYLTENPIEVIVPLRTPIETPLSAEELAVFKALGNPAGNVTIYSEADMAVTLAGSASTSALGKTQQDVEQTKAQVVELSLRADGIDMSVGEVRSAANIAQNTADAAQNAANTAQNTAADAAKKAEEAKGEILSASTTYTQRADGVDIAVKELRQEVGTKAEQSQVSEITEHFRFAADGMTITNSANGMGINVSEQQVAFTGGNDPTTVITPNAMETTNLTVGIRLDVGGFSLIPRTNGNLSLRWTGG